MYLKCWTVTAAGVIVQLHRRRARTLTDRSKKCNSTTADHDHHDGTVHPARRSAKEPTSSNSAWPSARLLPQRMGSPRLTAPLDPLLPRQQPVQHV